MIRIQRFTLIAALAASVTFIGCSSSQEAPEREELPAGASSQTDSARAADGETEMREEAESMGADEVTELLAAQLEATATCAAGKVTVDGENKEVNGIHYQRWVNESLGESVDHFHVFSEPVDCESSVDDIVEAYALVGHITKENFGPQHTSVMSHGRTIAPAPLSVDRVEDRFEICFHEPVTITGANGRETVWEGRFQATAYCGSRQLDN